MSEAKRIVISPDQRVAFNNNADFCVGTGRMYLALHKEYLDQLKMVQDAIGFTHIRGHGLFHDDMAICQRYEDESGHPVFEFNFTYVDMVMDSYLGLGLRPFIELGFMPAQIASGDQTVFYWKGNVTPPKNHGDWTALIKATLGHLIERYGREEVLQWPIEVWNEPNLTVFWKGADMGEYFRLYERSARAVKEVDPAFKVGGPAICGVEDELWIRSFLEFVQAGNVPLDFVTRHHYTSQPPKVSGHYSYIKLHELDDGFRELERTRRIVDGFAAFKGMDIHVTEFNTSYVPDAPIHDTNLNAAYVAAMLSRLGDSHASYSYWTFGDIFEEKGVPFTPFHGGFGLVANGCIPKPTFWTFAFYKKLQGDCVHRSGESLVVRRADGGYRGVLWNADPHYSGASLDLSLVFPAVDGDYCLLTKTVDEECCNPLKVWHDMGEPSHLSPDQKRTLREHAVPLLLSRSLAAQDSKIEIPFNLKPNGVTYFELTAARGKSDRGYSYGRILKGE